MADEDTTATARETAAVDTAPLKKTRKRRQPKVAADATASTDVVSDARVKKTRAKRGSKAIEAKAPKPRGRAETKSAPAVDKSAQAASTPETSDEFADLIALEEENKNLRKQLSEKLRTENADLRKRLAQK